MAASYQEQTSGTLPDWNTQVMDLLNKGKTQAGAGYQPYGGQLTAGLTPQQQAAFQQASSSVGNWQPGLTQAGQLIGQSGTNPMWGQAQNAVQGAAGMDLAGIGSDLYEQAQQGIQGAMGADLANVGNPMYSQAADMFTGAGQYDQNQVGQYLNPYLSGVVGEIGRLGNEQFQNQVLPGLTGAFSGLGQHGSARQAMMMSDAAARNQREILGQQATALNTGYTNAMGDYLNWAKQGQASAQGLAGLGGQMYNQALGQANLGLQGSQALAGLGAQQYTQGLGQANLGLEAGRTFGNLANQQSGAQLAAGAGLGNLAQAQQQLSIGDYGQLLNAGTIQQQQKQKELDAQYGQWQQKQQYPWEQLGNYAKLFGAGTPQQSTNWSASFKKGGLARFADGGRFPDTLSLIDRMREDGYSDDEIMQDFDTGGSAFRSRLTPFIRRPQDILRAEDDEDDEISAPAAQSNLMQRAFDERVKLLERARNAEYLQPMEEGSTIGNIGEALMRASAEGPAHWGQILGRSGASYFDKQNAVRNENKSRELTRLALEEKIAPEVGRAGGLGSGAMPGYVSVTGQDGRRFMVNRLDPNDRIEIGTGVNQGALHDAADRYAREQIKDSIFKDDAEREQRYDYHKRNYIERRVGQQPRAGDQSVFPDVPGRTTPAGGGDSKVILNPAEKAQQEKIGAAEGEEYAGIVQSGAVSRGQLSTLDFLESNFDKITTGRLTPALTEIKAWANAFGLDFEEDIAPAQAIQAISGQLALTLRNPTGGAGMPGALSDRDLQFLKSMVPQLGNDDKSNRLILDYARRIAKRNIEVSRRARKYVNRNPRKVLDEGFYDELEEWSFANPLFKEADAPVETDDSRKAAAASAGGRQRIKVTPEMLRGQ